MDRLTLDALDSQRDSFDAAVLSCPDIDHFCSRTDWIIPAHTALMEDPRDVRAWQGDGGFVALCVGVHPYEGWRYIQPLEAMWCFACPVVGADAAKAAAQLAEACRADESDWDVAMIAGLQPGSELLARVAHALAPRYRLGLGPSTRRYGLRLQRNDAVVLDSLSRNLRKSIRRARRQADSLGITFEDAAQHATPSHAAALFERIVDVESRSWKGLDGVGIDAGPMRRFYAAMIERLLRRRALHLWFARYQSQDIAYILGGASETVYRGLQFSHDQRFHEVGLGNLSQAIQIEALCEQGYTYYDLGSDVEYKRRWGDVFLDTVMIVASR